MRMTRVLTTLCSLLLILFCTGVYAAESASTGSSTATGGAHSTGVTATGNVTLEISSGSSVPTNTTRARARSQANLLTDTSLELNTFIVGLYKPKIDKLLEGFQSSTKKAARGDTQTELATYLRLLDVVDRRIASLDESDLTPNRRAVLMGVLTYLRDGVERMIVQKRREITNSFDS